MYLAYLTGTSTADPLEALYGDPEKKSNRQKETARLPLGDTVSLSAEALELAAAAKAQSSGQTETNLGQDITDQESGEEGGVAGAAGGGGGGGSDESAIERLEAKIKELQQKLMSVQSSNLPEETKGAMAASVEAELNAAIQELNALKAQAGG